MSSRASILLNAHATFTTEKGFTAIEVFDNWPIFGFVANQQKAAIGVGRHGNDKKSNFSLLRFNLN